MRVCFTSDLHGSTRLYDQLAELLRTTTPELLILGGDLFRDVDPNQPVPPQIDALTARFIERIETWRTALPRLIVACILGNHELAPMWDTLRPHHDAGTFMLLSNEQVSNINGLTFVGYSSAPPSPHWAKDFERLDMRRDPIPKFAGVAWNDQRQELRQVDLARHFGRRATILQQLEQTPPAASPWIFVAHPPPYESKLDRLPNVPYPIGSKAVRQFIEDRQPFVSLHGHVHESPEISESFTDRIGQTLCVNPGQGHQQLQAVIFDADDPAGTIRHTVFS